MDQAKIDRIEARNKAIRKRVVGADDIGAGGGEVDDSTEETPQGDDVSTNEDQDEQE